MCGPANEAWSDGLETENNAGTGKSVGGECPHLDRWEEGFYCIYFWECFVLRVHLLV